MYVCVYCMYIILWNHMNVALYIMYVWYSYMYMCMYFNAITLCCRCTDEAQKAETLGC